MKAIMKLDDLTTIDQLTHFLSGTQAVAFSVTNDKDACYRWIQQALVKFRYLTLNRQGKGVVIRYLIKVSGYSRQQLTRLIAQYRKTGRLQRRQRAVSGFKRKYTEKDVRLLAAMDERHDTPCGHAIKKLCERAYGVYGETEYKTLSAISVSHLYNLRKSANATLCPPWSNGLVPFLSAYSASTLIKPRKTLSRETVALPTVP
jgi:transposase